MLRLALGKAPDQPETPIGEDGPTAWRAGSYLRRTRQDEARAEPAVPGPGDPGVGHRACEGRGVSAKSADRNAIWDALPGSFQSRETAAEIADRAGVNRRSCGTKLSAMRDDYQALGLRWALDETKRQLLWWRIP